MSLNDIKQFNIAKKQTELAFVDLLKQGYISISPTLSSDKYLVSSYLHVNHILDDDIDKKLHVDIQAITSEYELVWFDVKHRKLPTTYVNYSISKSCFEYFNDTIKNKDLFNLYYFAFMLDDGNKYLNEFLVVKAIDIINFNKFVDKNEHLLFNINDLKCLPQSRIFKPDF